MSTFRLAWGSDGLNGGLSGSNVALSAALPEGLVVSVELLASLLEGLVVSVELESLVVGVESVVAVLSVALLVFDLTVCFVFLKVFLLATGGLSVGAAETAVDWKDGLARTSKAVLVRSGDLHLTVLYFR